MEVALGVLVNIFRHLLRSSQIWRFCATVKHEATCIEALVSVFVGCVLVHVQSGGNAPYRRCICLVGMGVFRCGRFLCV